MKQEISKEKLFAGLTPKAVFGIRTDIPQNIEFFSGDKCAFVAGNYIVIQMIKEKTQYFFPAHPELGEITAFSIDEYNDSIILVIGQKAMSGKSVLYVRFMNRNYLNQPEMGKTAKLMLSDMEAEDSFISISVNVLRGYIAALIGPKTPSTLAIFHHDLRNGVTKIHSIVHMSNQTAYKSVEMNILNPYFISLHGDGGFAVVNINEQDKKTISKLEVEPRSQNFQEFSNFIFTFVSSTWASKTRLILLNSACDVFVIDFYSKYKLENNYKKVIKNAHIFETQSRGRGVFCKHGNLFICRDDGIIVKLEDKQQSEKIIVYEKMVNSSKYVPNLPKLDVHSLSLNNQLNSNSHYFGILLSSFSGQVYYIDISNENSLSDGSNYKYLISPFHSDEVVSMDVSKLKHLVVTCCRDKKIRLWNYQLLVLEMEHQFEEDPVMIAFHPAGLHLAVLFRDKLQLLQILEKKMLVYREIPVFQPTDLKFSNFGHFFSICYKNCFKIYNFHTCETVFNSKNKDGLNIHTDEVKCLTWNDDDSGFATCGIDGRAFYWDMFNKDKPQLLEFFHRDFHFESVCVGTGEGDLTLNRKKLFLMDGRYIIEVNERKEEDDYDDESIHNNRGSNAMVKISSNLSSNLGNLGKNEKSNQNIKKERFKILMNGRERILNQSQSQNQLSSRELNQPSNNNLVKSQNNPLSNNSNNPNAMLKFSNFIIDQDSKLVIATTMNEHQPNIHISSYPYIVERMDYLSYQANSHGVTAMKLSNDYTHLFTGGSDKCFFIFNLTNAYKSDQRDETMNWQSLVLVSKEELDQDAFNLETKLFKIDHEIDKEIDNNEVAIKELLGEFDVLKAVGIRDKDRFKREREEIDLMMNEKVEEFDKVLSALLQDHERKISGLKEEQERNKFMKDKDWDKENENMKNEKIKDEALHRKTKKAYEEELWKLKEDNQGKINKLLDEIKSLELKTVETADGVEKAKNELMESSDNIITLRRMELEELKKAYEKEKNEHMKSEEKIRKEILEIKANIKLAEAKRIEDRSRLASLQAENGKLIKSIYELQTDKREKEDTIVEKNQLKRSLEIENQELEKFKFVLNYKIKELKHEKDPKENNLAALEKKAKDMEKEIKSFETAQANYIVDLSTHHEIMKLHHKQITQTENNIEKLKNYIRLFQDSLYEAMNRATNPKELKKELIHLKQLFLDKEFIEVIEKPFEQNYEAQRQFLENNLADVKGKIDNEELLLSQDFTKIMRENKKLLVIINELEKEKKEIESTPYEFYSVSKSSALIKPKMSIKPVLPFIRSGQEVNKEQKMTRLKNELFEIEKEIQSVRELKKKEQSRKIKMAKVRIVPSNPSNPSNRNKLKQSI